MGVGGGELDDGLMDGQSDNDKRRRRERTNTAEIKQ